MATLKRSSVSFRRQGSSGSVGNEFYVIGDDGSVHYRDQLRPCQSTRERIIGSSSSAMLPTTCPRSMSTPVAMKNPHYLNKILGKLSAQENNPFPKVPKIPKSKSKKYSKAQFQLWITYTFYIVKLLASVVLFIHYLFPNYFHNKSWFMYYFFNITQCCDKVILKIIIPKKKLLNNASV